MAIADRGMRYSLRALNGLARLELLDRLGVRQPVERLLYNGSKTSVRTAGRVGRAFNGVASRGRPARPPPAPRPDPFDPTPPHQPQMLPDPFPQFPPRRLGPP